MGLNMPARSVVFTSLKKWDGEDTRYISSGEYTQMSGRAGRRGKDRRGNAIVFVDDSLKEDTFKEIVKGTASPLVSSFKLSYYTLVNVLRHLEGTGKSIEYVISRSFSQFQYEKQIPGLKDKYEDIKRQADGIEVDGIEEYITMKSKLEGLRSKISDFILKPDLCLQFLRPGRIVRVSFDNRDAFFGIVVSTFRMDDKPNPRVGESYMIDLLLCCEPSSTGFSPCSLDRENGQMVVVPVMFSVIKEIYALRISLPNDLKPASSRNSGEKSYTRRRTTVLMLFSLKRFISLMLIVYNPALQTLRELKKSYAGGNLPELDPVRDFGVSDVEIIEDVSLSKKLASEIANLDSQVFNSESLWNSFLLLHGNDVREFLDSNFLS